MLKNIAKLKTVLTAAEQEHIKGGSARTCSMVSQISYTTPSGQTIVNQGWECTDGYTYTVTHYYR